MYVCMYVSVWQCMRVCVIAYKLICIKYKDNYSPQNLLKLSEKSALSRKD